MGRKHIFVVNGSPDFLDVVRELLQEERYNVTTTNFVPRTFDQIEALDPSLLIIDLAVGIMAGWELLERLSRTAATRDIPVIVVSTDPTYLDTVRADPARYGGQRLLRKPFELGDLLTMVDDLIGPA
jgi:CheY-like chemotaxis protein